MMEAADPTPAPKRIFPPRHWPFDFTVEQLRRNAEFEHAMRHGELAGLPECFQRDEVAA